MTIDLRVLDLKNIERIKTELKEIKFNCAKVLKQLQKVKG